MPSTDFSKSSQRAFDRLCDFFSKKNVEILIYHVIPRPFKWTNEVKDILFGAQVFSIFDYLNREKKNAEGRAQHLTEKAKKMGIRAKFLVEVSSKETSQSILATAKNLKMDMIALATQSGPMIANILGSTTRGVIREASTPVWVMGRR